MDKIGTSIAFGACLLALDANATLINGDFEFGFVGWETLGDASIQTADLGAAPTDGQQQAWITTLCSRQLEGGDECATTLNELPYSDTNAMHVAGSIAPGFETELLSFVGVSFAEIA